MTYLEKTEKKKIKSFLRKGYFISRIEDKKSLNYIKNKFLDIIRKNLRDTSFKNFNIIHKKVSVNNLNNFRLKIIQEINNDEKFKLAYFKVARDSLYTLVGNELMMQKNINLSIQFPRDKSSLLPIHSDVWSGDSPYEINLWLPLVDCFKTKSMYILEQKNFDFFKKKINTKKISSSAEILKLVKNKIKFLNVKYGEFLLFNQSLPHGNMVNNIQETRWSMNCRFKSLFSPYEDKRIGEFFVPITMRPMTEVGINYKDIF